MNYVSAARRPNPAAALGALGIPAAFGALLVIGLAVKVVIPDPPKNPTGFTVPIEPIETPPEPVIEPDAPSTSTPITRPMPETLPPRPLPPVGPITLGVENAGPITGLPGLGEIETSGISGNFAIQTPAPLFDPVAAIPRGDPGRWITDSDYRTSWINRGYSGVAGFALSVDANGRVSDCSITRSTGHGVLDAATCRLIERRARFDPARDSNGAAISGSFSSSVSWNIPE